MFGRVRSLGLALLLGVATVAMPTMTGAAPETQTSSKGSVSITGNGFSPQNVSIDVGGTITWTNNSNADQAVVSDAGIFDSGTIKAGATYQLVFGTAGVYPYHSSGSSGFRGTVTVGGSTAAAPSGQQQGMYGPSSMSGGQPPLYPAVGSGQGQGQALGATSTTTATVQVQAPPPPKAPEQYNPLTNYGGNGYGDYGVYCSNCGLGGIFRGYATSGSTLAYGGYGYGGYGYGGYGYGGGYPYYGGYGYGGYGYGGYGYGSGCCGGYGGYGYGGGYPYYGYGSYGSCGGCGYNYGYRFPYSYGYPYGYQSYGYGGSCGGCGYSYGYSGGCGGCGYGYGYGYSGGCGSCGYSYPASYSYGSSYPSYSLAYSVAPLGYSYPYRYVPSGPYFGYPGYGIPWYYYNPYR